MMNASENGREEKARQINNNDEKEMQRDRERNKNCDEIS